MISTIILSALVGFLIGMAICYGRQIKNLYDNRGKLSAANDVVSSVERLAGEFGIKF